MEVKNKFKKKKRKTCRGRGRLQRIKRKESVENEIVHDEKTCKSSPCANT